MDYRNCPCKPDLPDHLRYPDIKPTDQQALSVFKHFTSTCIFEATAVGTTSKKNFRILNESKEMRTYIAQRDPNTNPIYHAFDFKVAKTAVASGDYLECTVSYSPQVTHEKNVDYFQIVDSDLKLYKICLQGECIGPVVNISIQTLYFYNTKRGQQLINTFEIRNTSSMPATFQFDKNEEAENQEIFKLNKVRGILGPYKHVFVTVKFDSKKIGIYSQQLVCTIMNHAPITIELVGVQTINLDFSLPEVTLKRFSQTEELKGYSYYMYDSVKTTMQKPPFSLSVNYLDFGRVEYQKNANNSRTLVTSLTNHLKDQIEVVWQNSNKGIFSITPEEIFIPPGESVLYECQFQPTLPDQLYTKLLSACVYWTNFRRTLKEVASVEVLEVPLNITLRVLGHSFPQNKEWLPRVDIIPDVVILPPCMPMSPTYTTFILKSSGHLPASFKFVPPKRTNFLLKPMVGIIYDYQIVVIQLQPDVNDKKAYIERWGLELNGRTEECSPFYLKGYSENAFVTIGINNVVAFNTVHPGCQDISTVMIKNTSVHFLTYNFLLDEDSPFSIEHPQGQLASNETIFLQWYFTGHLKAPEVSVIQCEVRTVQKIKVVTGAPLDAFVTVYTKCSYSELCAIPNCDDFGEIQWGKVQTTSFNLFNFGESPIHFKLIPKQPLDEAEQFSIIPSQGTVNPREKKRIVVNNKATKTGPQKIEIVYKVRLNEMSNIFIDDGREYDIFSIDFCCIYPTLQIEDISANNFGFLFSKVVLWDMFKIDEINKILREIEHHETKTVEISVPNYEMGEADFFATLVVRNITQFSTEMQLKRVKLCECKLVTKPKGLSLRERIYDCIHRDMLKMTLSDEVIEAQHLQMLRMDVKYLERGLTQMKYDITLSNNRRIDFYINVYVLPEEVTVASKYAQSYDFQLKSVFIGEKEPPAQVFPFYNNSAFVIDYEVDTTSLSSLNFDYGFDILTCKNPKGTILPFTSINILFTFVPIEVRSYKVAVPFKMGENEVVLQIYGEGVLTYDTYISDMISTMPSSSKGMFLENPIELSTDHLVIEPFPVWSTVEKLLFIRNQTTNRIIGYSWQRCIVEGTVKAEMIYKKGVLQPKESHAVIVRINSFDQPCRLRLQMACKLLDHTQHILHTESVVAYNNKRDELEGQFTVTEKGIFFPKNDVIILPNAENFFKTLAISLCITSIPDKDLCMNKEKQLEQSPQYSLHVDMANIFSNYFESFVPKKSHLDLQALQDIDKIGDQKNPNAQKQCYKISLDKHSVKMFKTVVECLIADTVLSDLFCKIIDITNNSSQPYYPQFNVDDNQNTHCVTPEDVQERAKMCLEKRIELVEDFLNKPQAPFLANVFKELIADGIHETFQLGPQIKNRAHKPDTYYFAKSKFKCPSCKCNL